jgi:hypothetical protein
MFHGGTVRRPFRSNGGGTYPIFSAPLTTSIVPNVATGSGTPTYSRATAAYVQDHEAVQRVVLANEARFWGARRVRNLLTFSETFSNAAWQVFAGAAKVGAGPSTGLPAGASSYEVSFGATGGTLAAASAFYQTVSQGVGRTYTGSIWVRAVSGSTTVRLAAQTASGGDVGTADTTVTTTWQRLTYTVAATADNPTSVWALRNNVAGNTTNLYVAAALVEEVSGQSVQTPSEYVSTSVLSTPYQGANVDGVQYFDTVRLHTQNMLRWSYGPLVSGTPGGIQTGSNTWVENTPEVAAPDGTYTALKHTATSGLHILGFYIGGGVSGSGVVPGATYEFSFYARLPTSGAATNVKYSAISTVPVTADIVSPTSYVGQLSTGAWTRVSFQFTVPPTVTQIQVAPHRDGGSTGDSYIWGLQLRRVIPSIVNTYLPSTNVAYSESPANTVNTGTTAPIPATTLLGYYSEGGGSVWTQLVTPVAVIRDMSSTWTLGATMTRAANSQVGADGVANTATRLTGGAVAGTNTILLPLAGAASSRVYSCYMRRISGTGQVRLFQGATFSANLNSQLVVGQWVKVYLNASVDVSVLGIGIQIDTLNDVVDVDFNQFEAGAQPTSPMTTATRNPDALTYNPTGNIDRTVGAAYLEGSDTLFPIVGTRYLGNISVNVGLEVVAAYADTNAHAFKAAGGLVTSGTGAGGSFSAATPTRKFASNWSDASALCSIVCTGGALNTGAYASGPIGALFTLEIGRNGTGSAAATNPIRNVRIYSQKLSDAQLTAMVA